MLPQSFEPLKGDRQKPGPSLSDQSGAILSAWAFGSHPSKAQQHPARGVQAVVCFVLAGQDQQAVVALVCGTSQRYKTTEKVGNKGRFQTRRVCRRDPQLARRRRKPIFTGRNAAWFQSSGSRQRRLLLAASTNLLRHKAFTYMSHATWPWPLVVRVRDL